MTTGMHLVQKAPPTNTVVHTSSGYSGNTTDFMNLTVCFRERELKGIKKKTIIDESKIVYLCDKEKHFSPGVGYSTFLVT